MRKMRSHMRPNSMCSMCGGLRAQKRRRRRRNMRTMMHEHNRLIRGGRCEHLAHLVVVGACCCCASNKTNVTSVLAASISRFSPVDSLSLSIFGWTRTHKTTMCLCLLTTTVVFGCLVVSESWVESGVFDVNVNPSARFFRRIFSITYCIKYTYVYISTTYRQYAAKQSSGHWMSTPNIISVFSCLNGMKLKLSTFSELEAFT